MEKSEEPIQLNNDSIDYITSIIKGALGFIPFAGSLLSELVGSVIPNQRADRIARFVANFEHRILLLEKDFVRSQLQDENFTDLFEEGVRQSTRALSEERIEYIVNIITNSLSQHEIEYIESRHLLDILGRLNDIEIIWLMFYRKLTIGGEEEFFQKHEAVLNPVVATLADPQSIHDKEALQESYKEHLVQQDLLQPVYQIDINTHLPVYDRFSGKQIISSYGITPLGIFLLRQIGLENPD